LICLVGAQGLEPWTRWSRKGDFDSASLFSQPKGKAHLTRQMLAVVFPTRWRSRVPLARNPAKDITILIFGRFTLPLPLCKLPLELR
jgi:hypothetical protein